MNVFDTSGWAPTAALVRLQEFGLGIHGLGASPTNPPGHGDYSTRYRLVLAAVVSFAEVGTGN